MKQVRIMNDAMNQNKRTRKRGADPTFPRLLGDRLCLDFANTIEGPHSGHPEEFIFDYADLIRWGRHVGILSHADVERLITEADSRPDEAAGVFARALALRAAITRIFSAVAAKSEPEQADLELLQGEYLRDLVQTRLEPGRDTYAWRWSDDAALDRPLWEVARSAIDLLTRDDLKRVKQCPGAGDCGWLFYDTSKNASRRWCSMEGCGSRVKMRNQYARQKAAQS
jgi:predicted RNA-binding Zn ribbon-like protein